MVFFILKPGLGLILSKNIISVGKITWAEIKTKMPEAGNPLRAFD
jgi:hypothetical protein